jgi:hypothetical protein
VKPTQKRFFLSLAFLMLTAVAFNRFLAWHELREGIFFDDPVFGWFKSIDVSVVTFLFLYGAIGFFIIYHFKKTEKLTILAISYALVLILRMVTLYFLPFYADADATKLNDPFLNTFIYPGNYVARDLFFSGHAAILLLMLFIAENRKLKLFYLLMTVFISILLVIQKVHFSIDILGAPFFSLLAYWLALKIYSTLPNEKLKTE